MEAVIHVELRCPNYQDLYFSNKGNEWEIKANLDLIEEAQLVIVSPGKK
jgi:hypothetical protein